jgi:hypothetical protein
MDSRDGIFRVALHLKLKVQATIGAVPDCAGDVGKLILLCWVQTQLNHL